MSRQNFQTFGALLDFVVQHAEKQGCYGMGELRGHYTCRYRGDNGSACMVGAIIADEDYRYELEGCSAGTVGVRHAVMMNCDFRVTDAHMDVLMKVQGLHDSMAKLKENYPDFVHELRRTVQHAKLMGLSS